MRRWAFVQALLVGSVVHAGVIVSPGARIVWIVADPVQDRFYAALDSNEVVVVSAGGTVVDRIGIPEAPGPIAVDASGSRLYVALTVSHDVGVVDLGSGSYSATIALGDPGPGPTGLGVGRPGRLYVVSNERLTVVDTSANAEIGWTDLADLDLATFQDWIVKVSPDGKTLYLAEWRVDPASIRSFDVTTDVPALHGAECCEFCFSGVTGFDFAAGGSQLWVTTSYGGAMLMPAVPMFREEKRILFEHPRGGVLSPNGAVLYGSTEYRTLVMADVATLLPFREEVLSAEPEYLPIAISASGGTVAVPLLGNSLELVDVGNPSANKGGVKWTPVDATTGNPILTGYAWGFQRKAGAIDSTVGTTAVAPMGPSSGSYTITIMALGYESQDVSISIQAGAWTDLGTIVMVPDEPPRPGDSCMSPPVEAGTTADVIIHSGERAFDPSMGVVSNGTWLTVNSFAYVAWDQMSANVTVDASAPVGSIDAYDVTSANGNYSGAMFVLPAACPSISLAPASLPAGAIGSAYQQTISASGGTAPYTYSISAGALPPGLALSIAGSIDGVPTTAGAFGLTVTAADSLSCEGSRDYTIVIPGAGTVENIVVGQGLGQPVPNRVRVFRFDGSATQVDFLAYGAGQWGVNVTAADLKGNPEEQIATAPGPGSVYGPQIRGFLRDGTPIAKINFFAYGTLKFGANVGAGDPEVDAYDEILSGAGPGEVFGPHVRGFDFDNASITPIAKINFFAYQTLKFGVNLTTADVEGDLFDELATGAGPGPIFGPQVRGWDYDGGPISAIAKINFAAYSTTQYGVWVDGGDVEPDGFGELVTAPGPGAGSGFAPRFRGFDYDGGPLAPIAGFDTTIPSGTAYGGRPGASDVTGSGADSLLCGLGPDPSADARIRPFVFTGGQLVALLSIDAFPGSAYGVDAQEAILGF